MNTPAEEVHTLGVSELRWQCRRGLLELDYLLEGFLENHFESLEGPQQQSFIDLLGYPDPDLQQWLMAGDTPYDPKVIPIIQIIRKSVGLD